VNSTVNRKPVVCYVTDRCALTIGSDAEVQDALLQRVRNAAAAGVDWIQLREKDLDAQSLMRLAVAAISAARKENVATAIVVNDRLDIAWATRAAGVHLGETSLPVNRVVSSKRLSDETNFLIGVSCHSLRAAAEAERDGADYVFFGPVFDTPSKVSFGPPQGLNRLAAVASAVSIPVLAIGGITTSNARSCLDAGAAGIAAIRMFQGDDELKTLLATIRR